MAEGEYSLDMELTETTSSRDAALPGLALRTVRREVSALTHPGERWEERAQGRWIWQVRPEWTALLDTPDHPDWLNLQADPRARLIKTNDGRQVWRVAWGPRLVYVKVGRPQRRWARARQWLYGPDCAREAAVARYAAAHGVDCVVPIALGVAPLEGREPFSILITAGLPDARPLNEVWAGVGQDHPAIRQTRNQLIDAVAHLIARAHEERLEHADLHAGNILIEPTADGGFRALFVDLQNIRTGRPVTDERVVRNLAQLNQWFRQHAPLSDRIRFLYRYLLWRDQFGAGETTRQPLCGGRRELLAALDRAGADHARLLYRKRDRRCLRSGKYFARLPLADGWRAHVFLEAKHPVSGSRSASLRLTPEHWQNWLSDPPGWVRAVERRYVIKDSPSALIYRASLQVESAGPLDVICKYARPRNLLKRVQNLFRSSRPMWTWIRANMLLNRQIPTARPLAVLERRRWGWRQDTLIITEYLEHAHDLDALLTVRLRELDKPRQRRVKQQIISTLAGTLRRLHERGFVHRDLKAPNVMVQWQPDQEPLVWLVDLDGIRPVRRPRPAAEVRALGRLNVSLDKCRAVTRTDRLRFLIRYLARPGRPEPDWKPVWRQIERSTRRQRARRAD
ncbi:MAG: hypothetical protein AMXMBFR13_19390 [Phycisphaerae bacterium]